MQELVELGMQKTIVFTIAIALAANAQRIETESPDRHKVVRVKRRRTLSIIELAEPVTRSRGGKLSYRLNGRQQGVCPALDPEATTNLFIWHASGR